MAAGKKDDGKIGVGIIGTGGWANTHARALRSNPHVEIVGLAEVREGAAESFAQAHGLDVPAFTDYRDLIGMDGLDAVVVTTSNNVHAPASIAAAEAGKHVQCQKPMATTLAEAEAMTAAIEKANVVGMVGYTKRFFKTTRFLHDFLRSEDLGRVYHVRAFYFQSWLVSPATPMVWRLRREMTGTGSLGDLGSHATDLAQYLVGDDIARVAGVMRTFVDQRPSAPGSQTKETVDVDDAVSFCVEFKNGAIGAIQASRNATGRPDHWRVEIEAENGAIIYDKYAEPRIHVNATTGLARHAGWVDLEIPMRWRFTSPLGDDEHQNQNDHFVDCIRSGETPSPSFADGLKTERVMDAVVRSSETGAAVDVGA